MNRVQDAAKFLMSGKIDDSLDLCGKILEDGDDDVGVFYILALIYNIKKEYQKAVEACDKAIAKGAGIAEIYVEKARALQEIGDMEGALLAANKAVELAPPENGSPVSG